MIELFTPCELAIKLRDKGYDSPCLGYFTKEDRLILTDPILLTCTRKAQYIIGEEKFQCLAPLYQQVIDWFLIKHNIVLEILVFNIGNLEDGKFCFQWRIYNNSEDWLTIFKEFSTPKETMDSVIEEALKLI